MIPYGFLSNRVRTSRVVNSVHFTIQATLFAIGQASELPCLSMFVVLPSNEAHLHRMIPQPECGLFAASDHRYVY